jgi:hypothetical protein
LYRSFVIPFQKDRTATAHFDNGFAAAALFNRGDLVQSCRSAAGSTMSGTKTKQENPEAA